MPIDIAVFRGPDDNGLVVDGPGILAKKAFENGILTVGRVDDRHWCSSLLSRVETEKVPSSYGRAAMVANRWIPVRAMVISPLSTL